MKEYVLQIQQSNRVVQILMRFSDTLTIDYSVPEPENERGPHLHAETRKAYLVCHRFLSRRVSKVRKLHLLLGICLFFMHVSMSGGGHGWS
jgi:hypothetical protein